MELQLVCKVLLSGPNERHHRSQGVGTGGGGGGGGSIEVQ